MKKKAILCLAFLCLLSSLTPGILTAQTPLPPSPTPAIIYPPGGDISTMYSLTIKQDSPVMGGSVLLNPPGKYVRDTISNSYYAPGTVVSLAAAVPTPSPCPGCSYMVFSHFEGDIEGGQVIMDSDKNVTAFFTLQGGTKITPTPTPLPPSPTPAIIYPADGDISAMNILTMELNIMGGSVLLNPPGKYLRDRISKCYYAPGTVVSLAAAVPTPSPCPGCSYMVFSHFEGDLEGGNQVIMDSNKNVTAIFSIHGGSTPIPTMFIPGDVNGDRLVNIVDALMIARYCVGLDVPGFNTNAADVNADGIINIVDALLVAQFYIGLINGF